MLLIYIYEKSLITRGTEQNQTQLYYFSCNSLSLSLRILEHRSILIQIRVNQKNLIRFLIFHSNIIVCLFFLFLFLGYGHSCPTTSKFTRKNLKDDVITFLLSISSSLGKNILYALCRHWHSTMSCYVSICR